MGTGPESASPSAAAGGSSNVAQPTTVSVGPYSLTRRVPGAWARQKKRASARSAGGGEPGGEVGVRRPGRRRRRGGPGGGRRGVAVDAGLRAAGEAGGEPRQQPLAGDDGRRARLAEEERQALLGIGRIERQV